MLDEADVVAGLDARHRKQRHALAGAVQGAAPRAPGDRNLYRTVGRPFPVTVDLVKRHELTLTEPMVQIYRNVLFILVVSFDLKE